MVDLMVVAVGSVCVVVIAEGAIAAGYDAFVKAECSLRTDDGELAEIHLNLVMLRKFDVVGHGPPSNYPFRKVVAGITVAGGVLQVSGQGVEPIMLFPLAGGHRVCTLI